MKIFLSLLLAGALGAQADTVQPTPGSASKAVDNVTDVELEKHLVSGKITIVDFYADWCGPCRKIAPQLEDLVKSDTAVVFRKVNVDKNRPLAVKHGVRSIPHIIVYDKAGKSLGTIVGADIEGVKKLISKGKSGPA
jgi:thioredoxin 1